MLSPEDILLADSHSGEVNSCLNMDRMNEDYCLLVCDAVCDSNLLLRASFILVIEVAGTSETLMSVVTELILFTVVDRCILGL